MIISNEAHACLVYVGQDAVEYQFQLTYIDKTSLDFLGEFIPSDSRIDMLAHLDASLQDLVAGCPRELKAGHQFPTNLVGGGYTLPTDAEFDRIEGFPCLPALDYNASRLLSSFLPMLLRPLDVYYTKPGQSHTSIPSSMAGRSRHDLPDGSVLFLPTSANWGIVWHWLAVSYTTSLRIASLKALWLYGMGDLPNPENHIWTNPDNFYADTGGTWIYSEGTSIDYPSNVSLPYWNETGGYPSPVYGNRIAWKVESVGVWFFKELLYVPLAGVPTVVHPRKTPFSDTGGNPVDDDEFLPSPAMSEPDAFGGGFIFRPQPSPPPSLEGITVNDGLPITTKAYPSKPLSISS